MARNLVLLGLGSNLGDRKSYLNLALIHLKGLSETELLASNFYESKALLPENASEDWNLNYLNLAVLIETNLAPDALLFAIWEIEKLIGRKREGFWSPREIDIDILLYGDLVMRTEKLTIPHQHFLEREFALIPAVEIAPGFLYPASGEFYQKKLSEILLKQKQNTFCLDQGGSVKGII